MSQATRAAAPILGVALVLAAAIGCGHRLDRVLLPSGPTLLTLSHERIAPPSADTYAYRVFWSGIERGKRVDHYVWAVDPISMDVVDPTWTRTTDTRHTMAFPHSASRESHVFVVRAVDTDGGMSEPAWLALAEDGYPPMVVITSPRPDPFHAVIVPPEVTIQWAGEAFLSQPVKYKYRLFATRNPDFPGIPDFVAFARAYPDSVRRLYAPSFAGWDSVPAESTSVRYTGLAQGTIHVFAIVSFDRQGNYDALLTPYWNMLAIQVATPTTGGPILTMFNEYFHYTYLTGEWSSDPSRHVRIEVPAGQPVTINWNALPLPGADIAGYRWVLSPVDLVGRVPWADDPARWHHWSPLSLANTSATVGPFHPPPGGALTRWLYIEAEDTRGFRSLGIVEMTARRPAFNQDLLIVDDTRFKVDIRWTGGPEVDPPSGPWPTAAELDTFLFARGGFPWRGYPAGSISPPGIFNGYAFDTLGTLEYPYGVPLSLLTRYRHVIWYVETPAGSAGNPPLPVLRVMASPGHENALAAYIAQGGKVWLCGGGAAFATMRSWNRVGSSPSQYTSRDGELVPGRMMYDFAHWREGIEMLSSIYARKFGSFPWPLGGVEDTHPSPSRGWPPNPKPPTPPGPPDYSLLPATLRSRTPATDPVPPGRLPDNFFYPGRYAAEYISRATFIREDYDDRPNRVAEYSTLDTVYFTFGPPAPLDMPCMTYYHGRDSAPIVFSGFGIWVWQRAQCIQLVDWVLQSVWGLRRDPGASRAPSVPMRAGAASASRASRSANPPRRLASTAGRPAP